MLSASQIIKIYELVRAYTNNDEKAKAITEEIIQIYNTKYEHE
jgi:hypothetical protein